MNGSGRWLIEDEVKRSMIVHIGAYGRAFCSEEIWVDRCGFLGIVSIVCSLWSSIQVQDLPPSSILKGDTSSK